MKALWSCLVGALTLLPLASFANVAPTAPVPEFQADRLGGFSCRTDADPAGLRVVAHLVDSTTLHLAVFERFSQVASAKVQGTISTLARGDWVFSSEGYGLVVSSKSEVRQLVNGDKIRLFPAEFLGLNRSGRSLAGSLVCVALAKH